MSNDILLVCSKIIETTIAYLLENDIDTTQYEVDNVSNNFANSFTSKIQFHFGYYKSIGISRYDHNVLGEFFSDHLPIIIKDYLPNLQLDNGRLSSILYNKLRPNLVKLELLCVKL